MCHLSQHQLFYQLIDQNIVDNLKSADFGRIGLVKFLLEVGALGGGFLLGAPVGIGTILVMALQASLFQFACKTCRFEPRDAVHEDVIDTLRGIFGRNN